MEFDRVRLRPLARTIVTSQTLMRWPPVADSHTTIASRDLTMIRTVPLPCIADSMPGDQHTISKYCLALGGNTKPNLDIGERDDDPFGPPHP